MKDDIQLELILLEFANRVLDVRNGNENPTLGNMIDVPKQAISNYIDSTLESIIDGVYNINLGNPIISKEKAFKYKVVQYLRAELESLKANKGDE
jgi:hypothetical protein